MKKLKFECIKGMATSENLDVVVMQGDIVEFISGGEGEVNVEGIAGWSEGIELTFTPKQFVEHFKSTLLTIKI
jgi:hypothetical protein